jgi:hypothetical protein
MQNLAHHYIFVKKKLRSVDFIFKQSAIKRKIGVRN